MAVLPRPGPSSRKWTPTGSRSGRTGSACTWPSANWKEALKIADHIGKNDKRQASWMRALVYLKQGDCARALPEVEVLQHAAAKNKNDRQLELQLLEVQGLYLARTGSADAGLKLLARVVDRLKNDYNHHSWGNGAYYMESWGVAALQAGKYDVAEEAYLEALAHDPASVRAALGMQVLCERLGRTEEAQRFSDLASARGPGPMPSGWRSSWPPCARSWSARPHRPQAASRPRRTDRSLQESESPCRCVFAAISACNC